MSKKNASPPASWRDLLEIHPAAAEFPRPEPDELNALADDIAKRGLQNRVTVLQELVRRPDGTFQVNDPLKLSLLDGISRLDSMAKKGFQFRREGNELVAVAPDGLDAPDELCRYIDADPGFDPIAYVVSAFFLRGPPTTEK